MKTAKLLLNATLVLLLCLFFACKGGKIKIPSMPKKSPTRAVNVESSPKAVKAKATEGIVDHVEQLYRDLVVKGKWYQTNGANSVEEVENLKADLEKLENENAEYKNRSKDLMEELDEMIGEWRAETTKYVLIGSKKELKKGDVLKGRFLKKPALEQRFDNAQFDEIPMTKTTIEAEEKIKNILPTRQASYYEIQDKQLLIKDPENFWKVSNYLVIQTK